MRTTKIEWTERTWNPVTGCTKISTGGAHCYAETMASRLKAMGNPKYCNGFIPTIHPEALTEPIKWRNSSTVFVCSMADLFHDAIPDSFIYSVFDVIEKNPQHIFQVLTKRPERMAKLLDTRKAPPNAWLGVTVENMDAKYRIDVLRNIEAKIHFLSCEPLLSSLGIMDLNNIQWVIVGGESGPQARPMSIQWVREIHNQSIAKDIPFFFKQWGTYGPDGVKRSKKANGKSIDGRIIQMFPDA